MEKKLGLCPNCKEGIIVNITKKAGLCPKCSEPYVVSDALEQEIPSSIKLGTCPNCNEGIIVNITKKAGLCPKCSEPYVVSDAIIEEKEVLNKEENLDDDFLGDLNFISQGLDVLTELEEEKEEEYRRKLSLAKSLLFREKYNEALKIYEGLIEENPNDLNGYMGIIRVHTKNYSIYEDEKINETINTLKFISIKEEVAKIDKEYFGYIGKRKKYFYDKKLRLEKEKEEELRKKREEERVRQEQLAIQRAYEEKKRQEQEEERKRIEKENYIKEKMKPFEYIVNADGSFTIIKCIDKEIMVIDNIENVKYIKEGAFNDLQYLEKVVLPEGMETIEKNLFENCRKLKTVYLPSTLTHIHQDAFIKCYVINKVNFNGDLSSWCKIRFDNYFSNPAAIAKELFIQGEKLVDLVIPSIIKEIGRFTFQSNNGLESVVISDTVTLICEDSFKFCNNIKKITIPFVGFSLISFNKYFGMIFGAEDDFDGHLDFVPKSLKEIVIKNKDNEIKIAEFSFHYCIHVEKIEINAKVKKIESQAFGSCSKLKNIVLPDSIEEICSDAFKNCGLLEEIVLPKSLRKIDDKAFRECSNLKTITLLNPKTQLIGSYSELPVETIYLPKVSNVNEYETICNLLKQKFNPEVKIIQKENL